MEAKMVKKADTGVDQSKRIFKLFFIILGEAALLAVLLLMFRVMEDSVELKTIFYTGTISIVCAAVVGTLLVTGLLRDFLRSFVYLLKQAEDIAAVQVKRSLLAVKVSIAAAVVSDLMVVVYFYIVGMMTSWGKSADELTELMPLILGTVGSYAAIGLVVVFVLLSVYARLKARLINMQAD